MTAFDDSLNSKVRSYAQRVERLVLELEANPPEDGGARAEWLELGQTVLDERHELELFAHGLEPGSPAPASWTPEALAQLVDADQQLEAQLFRLTLLNTYRQDKLEHIPPERRADTWWYSRGAHLPPTTVVHLSDVAALTACFPRAFDELQALKRAEELLSMAPSPTRATRVSDPGVAPPLPKTRSHKGRVILLASAAAGLLVLVGGGLAFMNAQEKAEKERAALQAQLAEAEANANKELERLEQQAALAGTMSQAEKDALNEKLRQAEAAARQAAQAAGNSSTPSSASARPPGTKASGPRCDPNDPMCGGL